MVRKISVTFREVGVTVFLLWPLSFCLVRVYPIDRVSNELLLELLEISVS